MRIGYIIQTWLTERDRRRYGVEYFEAYGDELRIVELGALFHPELSDRSSSVFEGDQDRIQPKSLRALHNAIAGFKEFDMIFCLAAYTGSIETLLLYRMLRRLDLPYVVLASNVHPGFWLYQDQAIGLTKKLRFHLSRILSGQVRPIHSLLFRLPPRLLGITAPAAIVHGGRLSMGAVNMFPVDPNTRTIWAHAYDFDEFVINPEIDTLGDDTAVYIDEHMGFQQDVIALGGKMLTTPERFYPKLRELFDRVEKELGLKVVVAANPRADLDMADELFGTRRVVKGQTARLIRESRMVMGHCSTAIGMAVMAGKPVILIATRETYAHWAQKPNMDAFSKSLNEPIRFFDDVGECPLDDALVFDRAAYDQYMIDYVKTPGSPMAPYWEVVGEAIRENLNAC